MNIKEFKFQCKVLNAEDKRVIAHTAQCLTETFAGIEIGGTIIREPMTHACKLSKNDLLPHVNEYIKNITSQGLCVIAITEDTDELIGAIACEYFNPNEDSSVFRGTNQKLNKISEFLSELGERFVKTIETRKSRKIEEKEYVHAMMLGIRAERNKKHIANEILKVLSQEAQKKNCKAIITEATSFKSQKFVELYGFHVARDLENKPITKKYSEDEIFKQIPADIASECKLMIMPLHPDYVI